MSLKQLADIIKSEFPQFDITIRNMVGGNEEIMIWDKSRANMAIYIMDDEISSNKFYFSGAWGEGGNLSYQQVLDRIKHELIP